MYGPLAFTMPIFVACSTFGSANGVLVFGKNFLEFFENFLAIFQIFYKFLFEKSMELLKF